MWSHRDRFNKDCRNKKIPKEEMTAVSLPLFIVDAFTTDPFRGNPAAVVVLPRPDDLSPTTTATTHGWALRDEQMLRIAKEMNLSETVFLSPMAAGTQGTVDEVRFGIRWFTPTMEVGLCGHATLAASHVLFAEFFSLLPERFRQEEGEDNAPQHRPPSATVSAQQSNFSMRRVAGFPLRGTSFW